MDKYMIKKIIKNIETKHYYKTIKFFEMLQGHSEDQNKELIYFENFDSYFDLITIREGVEYVTVPMPVILKILWNKEVENADKRVKKLIYRMKQDADMLLDRSANYDEWLEEMEEMKKMQFKQISKLNKKENMRRKLNKHLSDSEVIEKVISELDKGKMFENYNFYKNFEIKSYKNNKREIHQFAEQIMLLDESMQHSWAGETTCKEEGVTLFGNCKYGEIYEHQYFDNGNLTIDEDTIVECDFETTDTIVSLIKTHSYSDYNYEYYDETIYKLVIYKGGEQLY